MEANNHQTGLLPSQDLADDFQHAVDQRLSGRLNPFSNYVPDEVVYPNMCRETGGSSSSKDSGYGSMGTEPSDFNSLGIPQLNNQDKSYPPDMRKPLVSVRGPESVGSRAKAGRRKALNDRSRGSVTPSTSQASALKHREALTQASSLISGPGSPRCKSCRIIETQHWLEKHKNLCERCFTLKERLERRFAGSTIVGISTKKETPLLTAGNDLPACKTETDTKSKFFQLNAKPSGLGSSESDGREKLNEEKSMRISRWAKDVYATENLQSSPAPIEDSPSPITVGTPEGAMLEDGSLQCDSRATDTEHSSAQSDIYGGDDSIFGLESASDPPEWDHSDCLLERIKREYANYVISMVLIRLRDSGSSSAADGNDDGSPANSQAPGDSSLSSNGSPQATRGKRKLHQMFNNDGNSNGDGEDDDDRSRRTRPSSKVAPNDSRPRRFACPFFKRHPDRFRSCGLADYESPSRVKQHINRNHRRPIYCPKCSTVFKSEDKRDAHVRQNSCPVRPEEIWICATVEQLNRLSRRSTCRTDRENWNEIFKILFPNDPLPDSPYLDPSVSEEVNYVRELFLAAAPVALNRAIADVLPEDARVRYAAEIAERVSAVHVEMFEMILNQMRTSSSTAHSRRSQGSSTRSSNRTGSDTGATGQGTRSPDSGLGSSAHGSVQLPEQHSASVSNIPQIDPISLDSQSARQDCHQLDQNIMQKDDTNETAQSADRTEIVTQRGATDEGQVLLPDMNASFFPSHSEIPLFGGDLSDSYPLPSTIDWNWGAG